MYTEYDHLVEIYDSWSTADPAASQTLRFYTEICCEVKEEIVELGIGNGRIALEIAQRCNKHIIGIDSSDKMLAKCQAQARAKGLENLVQLINADFREFTLTKPAQLIIMPFRAFGHLLTLDDKLSALKQVCSQLTPGGLFVFDHYVFNENWARDHNGVPRLMCKSRDNITNKTKYIWDTYLYDFETQCMDCTVTVEEVEDDGTVINRSHYPLSFSWVTPDQVKTMILDAGLEIEQLYGSFNRKSFNNASKEQIWIAKRPNA